MNTDPNRADGGEQIPEPPRDELDALLRRWHQVNATRAQQGREALLQRLGQGAVAGRIEPRAVSQRGSEVNAGAPSSHGNRSGAASPLAWLRSPAFSLAACLVLLASIMVVMASMSPRNPRALRTAMRGELESDPGVVLSGARVNTAAIIPAAFCPPTPALEARNEGGEVLGPCALNRTDYSAKVSGIFARVTLVQRYHNPFNTKIEAVYTFPMSHRAAVDSMRFTIGDRVVVGEVKERSLARQVYESARANNQVAALLEQERPNIFTQSVANIEPGATIDVEISYIETIDKRDGLCSLVLPMVVAPRYIPGRSTGSLGEEFEVIEPPQAKLDDGDAPAPISAPPAAGASAVQPALFTPRNGPVVLGAASFRAAGEGADLEALAVPGASFDSLLREAIPIVSVPDLSPSATVVPFIADYDGGFAEQGLIRADGFGEIGGRCFAVPSMIQPGAPFASPTDQVPDADRITPMPAIPGVRSGHDVTVAVEIDTGGPAIIGMLSGVHDVTRRDTAVRPDGLPSRSEVSLRAVTDIPNRDFVLSWRESADAVRHAVFTHADHRGGFFTAMIEPPARVAPDQVVPRELIFVLDTSGSMSGFPIEKAKEVMRLAIDSMREFDTFNVITFAGSTSVLWDRPRPSTEANRAEAKAMVDGQRGNGGTEMMTAINAALAPTNAAPGLPGVDSDAKLSIDALANLPADGRAVTVLIPASLVQSALVDGSLPGALSLRTSVGATIPATIRSWTVIPGAGVTPGGAGDRFNEPGAVLTLRGRWVTRDMQRVLDVDDARFGDIAPAQPVRVVMFLTDGQVGNDMAIIDAVRRNSAHARVFSFGIGNSVNRYLLDGIAQAGRGAADYVLLAEQGDGAVARFTQRMRTPVLSNVSIEFAGAKVLGVVCPALLLPPEADPTNAGRFMLPDVYEQRPIIVHGRYEGIGAPTLAVTVCGITGSGNFEQRVDAPLAVAPAVNADGSAVARDAASPLPSLWARGAVGHLMNTMLTQVQMGNPDPTTRAQVVALGEQFGIVTQFTSFVAVERASVTVAGKPMLVHVPVEIPDGQSFHGIFGGGMPAPPSELVRRYREAEGLRDAKDLGDSGTVHYFGLPANTGASTPLSAAAPAAAAPTPAAAPSPAPTASLGAAPASRGADPMAAGYRGPSGASPPPGRARGLGVVDAGGAPGAVPAGVTGNTGPGAPGMPAGGGGRVPDYTNVPTLDLTNVFAESDFDSLDELSLAAGLTVGYIEAGQGPSVGRELMFLSDSPQIGGFWGAESLVRDPVPSDPMTEAFHFAAVLEPPEALKLEEVESAAHRAFWWASPSDEKVANLGDAGKAGEAGEAAPPSSSPVAPAQGGTGGDGGEHRTDKSGSPVEAAAVDDAQRAEREAREANEAELLWRRLHPVLIERLWMLAASRADAGNADDAADQAADRRRERKVGPDTAQRITLLVQKVDRETLAALAKAGLKILDSNARLCVVVGEVRLDRLRELALIDGVKRIEPTREQAS